MLKHILKEPLVHFLVAGICLFPVYSYIDRGGPVDQQIIRVTRAGLLTFVQNQARMYDEVRFDEMLDQMSDDDFSNLVAEYTREEALYRAARALDLDKNDYLLRRQLIRKLEFVTESYIAADIVQPDHHEITRYYEVHKEQFFAAPRITFAHVFFKSGEHWPQALVTAQKTHHYLNENRVPFTQAAAYGDRFYYHVNYVNKEADQIASHFGTLMQQKLFSLAVKTGQWQGPFRSEHGYHLVMVLRKTDKRVLPLAEVKDQIIQNIKLAQRKEARQKALASIVGEYRVEQDEGLRAPVIAEAF